MSEAMTEAMKAITNTILKPLPPDSITVNIKVTRWDILRGKPSSGSRCPLARAARRAFGGRREVHVVEVTGGGAVIVGMNSGRTWEASVRTGDWSPGTRQFVRQFDGGYRVKPQSFSMRFYGRWS